jgi:guanosine-3',5'-bis(diphosphate) 3'-pyrophosphohydrolase
MTRGEMLGKMLVLATTGHAGQFDKGGKPYILHPLAVMNILNTDDEELQCIALGHDLIEDTNATYQDLREAGMTERVIDGIRRMTKQPGQTLDEYKAVIFESTDAMLVKQADLTHNSDIRRLKGVSEKDIQRMAKYHRFYLEIRQRLEEKK